VRSAIKRPQSLLTWRKLGTQAAPTPSYHLLGETNEPNRFLYNPLRVEEKLLLGRSKARPGVEHVTIIE
jgi:hypothetical protein